MGRPRQKHGCDLHPDALSVAGLCAECVRAYKRPESHADERPADPYRLSLDMQRPSPDAVVRGIVVDETLLRLVLAHAAWTDLQTVLAERDRRLEMYRRTPFEEWDTRPESRAPREPHTPCETSRQR